MTVVEEKATKVIGTPLVRREDPALLTGEARFTSDLHIPGALHLAILRSPYANARITSVDVSGAADLPGVVAAYSGADLQEAWAGPMPCAWPVTEDMKNPTHYPLAVSQACYVGDGVAAVVATSAAAAQDALAAMDVQYEPLPVVVDPRKALEPGAPVLRTDKKDKHDNRIWHWEWGDRAATDNAFREAAVTVKQDIYLPRIHVASIETCGCVAQFDKVTGKLTVWMTTQAPHAIRTVFALVAGHVGLEEHKIRIISPDIGGGFGGKVPVYPGYVIAVAASVLTGKPVKWIEDRMENLQADSFARDYHITAELAATKEGKLTALRIKTLADHGYAGWLVVEAEQDPAKAHPLTYARLGFCNLARLALQAGFTVAP